MIKKLHDRTSALPKLLWLMLLTLLPAQLSATVFDYEYEGQNLRYVVLDEDAKTVSVDAPSGTSGEVIIPSEVTNDTDTYSVIAIADNAFKKTSVTSVTIPNSVTSIGEYAFFLCEELTSVTLGNSVTIIDYAAFCNCYSLNTVTIPNSVTTIESSAFYYSALTSITIPNSVSFIGKYAFGNCPLLKTATFQSPNKDLVLENEIFSDSSVNAIHFEGEGDYTIKSGMAQALQQSEKSDPNYVSIDFKGNYTIEEGAFEGISAYYLYFYGTSYIGKKAFYNSNPVQIYLEDCQGIEDYAFATTGYGRLVFRLWSMNEEPPYVTNENAFSGLPKCGDSKKDYIVFVPLKSIDKYKNAFGWTYFNVSGMGEINSLIFTPDEVHLDLRKSTTISYNLDATGDFEITESQWTSSDEEVVVVNQSGMIQGNASGMAMIYFSFDDNYGFTHKRRATLVTVGDVDFSLDAEAEQGTIAMGESTGVKLTYGGQGYTVESEQWASSDAEIATVDENGAITGVATGEATITLTVNFDNGLYATREIPVTVTEESGIDDVLVNGSDAPAEYYNLNGVRVANPENGFYIKRQGGKATKVLVK